jgi:hypothetical protein
MSAVKQKIDCRRAGKASALPPKAEIRVRVNARLVEHQVDVG